MQSDGLDDGPRFERELNKERARVDRGGPPFSLLAIDADLDRASEAYAQLAWTLAAVLSRRTRFVDTKGWFRGRIGVILPDTTSDEIPKICAQIEAAYRRSTGVRALSGTAGPPALRF